MTKKTPKSKGGLERFKADYKDSRSYNKKGDVIYPDRLGEKFDISRYDSDDIDKVITVRHEMLLELMDLYDIDRSTLSDFNDYSNPCWFMLASSLANEHVPGFCMKQKSGRPKTKTIEKDANLFYEVVRRKSNNSKKSISTICTHIHKDNIFPNYSSAKSINTRFTEIKVKCDKDENYKQGVINFVTLQILKNHD
ncbi:MAG: hypothetical protein QM484_06745 [Woeseiaceae bacterium]